MEAKKTIDDLYGDGTFDKVEGGEIACLVSKILGKKDEDSGKEINMEERKSNFKEALTGGVNPKEGCTKISSKPVQ